MSMQVTETSSAGLKREYRVIVPATDLEAKVNERLDDLKGRVQLRGFRPGKVPVAHLKRLYGKSAMAEVIEATVREANSKIVTDHGYRLAVEPKVVLPTEEGAVEGVIEGKADLSYTVEMEIVPAIALADFKSIKLTRLTSEVSDEEIDKALQAIADQNRPFVAKTEGAANGDRVTINFEGSLEGTPFEGGTGEDVPLVMGAGQFIPGFEENLAGLKPGENKTFDVKFPDDYRATHLAGKNATFAVTVKAVEAPGSVTIDDEFAKTLGVESLAKLKDAVKDRIAREHTLAVHRTFERAFVDEIELFVRVGVHARTGAARFVYVAEQHAFAFDNAAMRGRVTGSGRDFLHLGHMEMIFALAGPDCAGGLGFPGCHLQNAFLIDNRFSSSR